MRHALGDQLDDPRLRRSEALAAVQAVTVRHCRRADPARTLVVGWEEGLTAATGFGVYANRALAEDGAASARTIVGLTLAILAVIGAGIATFAP